MKARIALTFSMLLLAVAMTGCHKVSREDRIAAHNDTGFAEWTANHSTVFSPTELSELDTARQQIRFRVMQQHPGLMSQEFSDALYAEIDGHTVHELLMTGYALQVDRLKTELANYEGQLQPFKSHDVSALSDDQQHYVKESIAKLERLMGERRDELARVTNRLEELKRTPESAAH